jgi:hypothetical protein
MVSRRGTTVGLTVTSRGRLLSLLEARAGLPEPDLLPGTLERILVTESAREARVPLFDDDSLGAPDGAIDAVARLISALRLNGIAPAAYADAGGDRRAADAYARFEQRRSELKLADDADRVARLLSAGVPTLDLVIEDPSFPHRAALDLLSRAIDAAPSCSVGLPDFTSHGAPSTALEHLRAMGFDAQGATGDDDPTVKRAIGGAGMYDEVELVARHMLALLRSRARVRDVHSPGAERALRPGDILGVAPNTRYLSLLHEACARVGIPVASPRRVDALEIPLVRALVDAFALLANAEDDTPERGLALLATPYMGLSLTQHDWLAHALTLRGLGGMRSWNRHALVTQRASFQRFAEVIPVLAARIQGDRSPRELAGTLSLLALDYGLVANGRRVHLAANRDADVRLDQQGWELLTSAMDEVNEALRLAQVKQLPGRRWLALLADALSGRTARADARAVDGVHLTIAGAGLPSAVHVFAVGWREGLFPRRVREDPFLPDRVRRGLNEQGALLPLAADRVGQDIERRERIRRAARESLTISWPATDGEGTPQLPSFYLDDLGIDKETEITTRGVGDTTWPLALAASRGERLARATFLARHRPVAKLGDEHAPARELLATLTPAERRAYGGELHAPQRITLPQEIAAESARRARKMSASQANSISHCLYSHFGKRRLELEHLVPPEVDALSLGGIAHRVLAEIGCAGFDSGKLNALFATAWNDTVPDALRDDPAVEFDREILLEQLQSLVEAECDWLSTTSARPMYFELAFGLPADERSPRDAASLPDGLIVELPRGLPIDSSMLRGSIDRVDVVELDGVRYGVAIDYKLGKGARYREEMDDQADFQLPIYCELLSHFGITPVGALYLGLADGERHGVVHKEFKSIFVPDGSKGVKVLDEPAFTTYMSERQGALRGEIARVARGELEVKPRKDDCKYCDLRPVCRIGTFGAAGKGGARGDD